MTTAHRPTAVPPAPTPEPAWDIARRFPYQGHWTVDDVLGLPDSRRVELSHGYVQVLPVPTDYHQAIVGFIYRCLWALVDAGELGTVRFSGLKVRVSPEQLREPDVVFIRPENAGRRGNQFWSRADLTVEVVSDEYRAHDLETKRREYAQASIPEYWIVDPLLKDLTVLALVGTGYEPACVYRPGDRATSVLLPGFEVDVTDVFNGD
jgi:Uma2 family endonuclease